MVNLDHLMSVPTFGNFDILLAINRFVVGIFLKYLDYIPNVLRLGDQQLRMDQHLTGLFTPGFMQIIHKVVSGLFQTRAKNGFA